MNGQTFPPRLQVSDLAHSYDGVRAVDGVSFAVAAGEMAALIGPNGAGKSTCFNLINGQIRAREGRVRLDGADITGLSPRKLARAGVARTFQVAAAFSSMTVLENAQTALCAHAGKLWGWWRPAASYFRDEAMHLLARAGVADLAQRPCGALAYGDVKRVELAVALAGKPRLLLLDEPTAGMIPSERRAMMELVRKLTDAGDLAVLFTEHDMDAVFGFADRVLALHFGRLIADGPPAQVRADERVKAVYLGRAG